MRLIDQARDVDSINTICFEGGEPLLYLPQLLAGIKYAKEAGFSTDIVTNAYIARSEADAELLLQTLADAGLDSVTLSDDELHFGDLQQTPAKYLAQAAGRALERVSTISVEKPSVVSPTGTVMFRGRAADRMTAGLPRRPWLTYEKCPRENLRDPSRVHVDCFGNVLICQGISMGDAWTTPLARIFSDWRPDSHPICGPLLENGPAGLASRHGVCECGAYVDECHLCFEARRSLLDRFPEYLTPRQVYGM